MCATEANLACLVVRLAGTRRFGATLQHACVTEGVFDNAQIVAAEQRPIRLDDRCGLRQLTRLKEQVDQ